MLPALQPTVNLLTLKLETGRKTFKDGREAGAVALAAGEQPQPPQGITTTVFRHEKSTIFFMSPRIRGPGAHAKLIPGHNHRTGLTLVV